MSTGRFDSEQWRIPHCIRNPNKSIFPLKKKFGLPPSLPLIHHSFFSITYYLSAVFLAINNNWSNCTTTAAERIPTETLCSKLRSSPHFFFSRSNSLWNIRYFFSCPTERTWKDYTFAGQRAHCAAARISNLTKCNLLSSLRWIRDMDAQWNIDTTSTCTRCRALHIDQTVLRRTHADTALVQIRIIEAEKHEPHIRSNHSRQRRKKQNCDKRVGRRWRRRKEKKNLNGLAVRFNLLSVADTRVQRNDRSASVVSAWKCLYAIPFPSDCCTPKTFQQTKYYYFSLENLWT